MQIWWCHSSTFEDTPYKVYIFLKLRAFCNYLQQSETKQTYVEMSDHCELRAWGTLSQVGVSGYIEIHLLHCITYERLTVIMLSHNDCRVWTLIIGSPLYEVSRPNVWPRRAFVTCALYYNDVQSSKIYQGVCFGDFSTMYSRYP